MRKGLVSLVGGVNKKTGQYFAFHSQSKGASPPQWAQQRNHLWPWRVPSLPSNSLPVPGPDDDVPAAAHFPQDGRPARPHHLPAAAALRGLRPGGRQGAHRGERACRGLPPTPAVAQVSGQTAGARLAAVLQQHHFELSCEVASGERKSTSDEPRPNAFWHLFVPFFPMQRAQVTTERLFLPPQEWQCYFMCRLHCVFGAWHGFPLSGWFLCGMSLNICVFFLYQRAALLIPAKSSYWQTVHLAKTTPWIQTQHTAAAVVVMLQSCLASFFCFFWVHSFLTVMTGKTVKMYFQHWHLKSSEVASGWRCFLRLVLLNHC